MKDHLLHYTPLVGILAAAILGFAFVSYDRAFRGGIIVASAVSYVFWGLIHHFIHKDLYLTVILEYVVIAILGTVIGLSMVFRI